MYSFTVWFANNWVQKNVLHCVSRLIDVYNMHKKYYRYFNLQLVDEDWSEEKEVVGRTGFMLGIKIKM